MTLPASHIQELGQIIFLKMPGIKMMESLPLMIIL